VALKTREVRTTPVTLVFDDEVLAILRKRAEEFGQSLDEAASDLIRESAVEGNVPNRRVVNGILLLPNSHDRQPVTMETVNELRDDLP
jgi:hypothetical protein